MTKRCDLQKQYAGKWWLYYLIAYGDTSKHLLNIGSKIKSQLDDYK